MNPFIKQIEYAVRGAIVVRASELEKELEQVNIHIQILALNCYVGFSLRPM